MPSVMCAIRSFRKPLRCLRCGAGAHPFVIWGNSLEEPLRVSQTTMGGENEGATRRTDIMVSQRVDSKNNARREVGISMNTLVKGPRQLRLKRTTGGIRSPIAARGLRAANPTVCRDVSPCVFIATSTTTAPGRIQWPFTRPALPAADTTMLALRTYAIGEHNETKSMF